MNSQRYIHSQNGSVTSLIVLAVFLFAVLAGGGAFWLQQYFSQPGPLQEEATLLFPRGKGVKEITRMLAAEQVIRHPYAFQAMVLYHDRQKDFKAGEYRFEAGISPREVMDMLVSGRTVVHKLTIPEGLTVEEIKRLLVAEDKLTGVITISPEEGSLLPETYHFTRGETRDTLLRRIQADMENTLNEQWQKRSPGLPFATRNEALTLASIVEKETGIAEERGRVASVFINRLKKGMKLQADPTVVYGMTEGGKLPLRPIRKSDLERDQPYNTYVIPGLPPGPIANPGRAAIEAVLNPPDTDDLYFVATGDGGHRFAATHKEHLRNVAEYRKKLREQQSQQ